ncbi:hypothetical protein NC651_011556 [Populus alba x Populus x berolinensis]|nr:hypothetical protein NC651_011556 [Populus alba x Populus x berolinensis]
MAYKVQNHAFDLVLPVTNDDLLITVDTNQKVTCTHVPRQPQKRTYKSYFPILELPIMKSYIKALSLYNPQNLSSPKKLMVLLKSSSRKGESSTSPPGIFSSFISMMQPAQDPLLIPIESFSKDDLPVYSFSLDSHVFLNICNYDSCCNLDMDNSSPRQKRKSLGKKLKDMYNQGDRIVDALGQPFGKFNYLVKYTPPSWATPKPVPTVFMYQPTSP